jgi:hypothetical protein
MRRLLLVVAVVLTVCASAHSDEPVDREAAVRELLDRSRLLGDTHFTVPIGLWKNYLREKAEAAGIDQPPPLPLIAAEGEYAIVVQSDVSSRITATIRLHIFQPAKCRNLMVLTADKAWEKVTVNGQATALATVDHWLRFTPDEPGEYVIRAEVPIKGTLTLDLPIPSTARTFVKFDAPIPFEVTAEGAVHRIVGDSDGGTHGRLALVPRRRLKAKWWPPRVRYEREARYQLTGDIVWNLGAGSQTVNARLRVGILGTGSDRLDLTLPAGCDRVAITGPDVRDVQVSGDRATVFLRGRVRDRTRLAVTFERPAGKGATASLPSIAIVGGHWAGGTLVVTHSAGGSEVLPQSAVGLDELSLAAIPRSASAMMVAPPALSYRITSRRWSLDVETLNLGDYALRESVADLAHYEVALQADGSVMCKANYEVRNRTRQFLRFDLPRGSQVLIARVNELSQPLAPVPGAPEAYRVPLVRSKATVKGLVSFPVEIIILCRTAPLGPKGRLALPLPRIDLPVAYAWCELYVPRGAELANWTGPMRRVDAFSSETATASLTYGAAELAEGYDEDDRPTVELAAGEVAEPADATPVLSNIPVLGGLFTNRAQAIKPDADAMEMEEVEITAAVLAEGEPPAMIALPGVSVSNSRPSKISSLSLARNYFRAGRDYYEKGDFGNARKSLSKAVELAPGSVEAGNATRLLSNVRFASGKLKAKSQAEKAAGAQVQRELLAANAMQIEQQKSLLQQSQRSQASGQLRQAEVQLKAAQSLGERLLEQGVAVREQKKVLEETSGQLAQLDKANVARGEAIAERVEQLKSEGRREDALRLQARLDTDGNEEASKARTQLVLADQLERIKKADTTMYYWSADTTHSETSSPVPRDPDRGGDVAAVRKQTGLWRTRALTPSPLEREVDRISVEAPRLEARVRQTMAKASTARQQGDFSRALDRLNTARRLVDQSSTLTPEQSQDLRAVIQSAQNQVAADRGVAIDRSSRRSQEILQKMEERLETTREARAREIDGLWKQSQQLVAGYKYAEATVVLDQILIIDPGNAKARRFRQDYSYLARVADETDSGRMPRGAVRGDLAEAVEKTVPRYDIYRSPDPKVWAEMTDKRKKFVTERHDIRALRQKPDELQEMVREVVKAGGDRPALVKVVAGSVVVTATGWQQKQVRSLVRQLEAVQGPQVERGQALALQSVRQRQAGGGGGQQVVTSMTVLDLSDRMNLNYHGDLARSAALARERRIMEDVEKRFGTVSDLFLSDVTLDFDIEFNNFDKKDMGLGHSDDTYSAYMPDVEPVVAEALVGWVYRDARPASGKGHQRTLTAGVTGEGGELKKFIERNYDWFSIPIRTGEKTVAGDARRRELERKLRLNWNQKVPVNSINLNVAPQTAAALGVRFTRGRNGVVYATIDEAQFRTLAEVSAGRPVVAVVGGNNVRWQDTIVGTDALLANGMVANITFAGDYDNTLDLNGNSLKIVHEDYLVINNGGYLTAIRADQMQHWTETPSSIPFAVVPQTLDVPRVGRQVRLEKTLVEPTDDLVIRANYVWKGDS